MILVEACVNSPQSAIEAEKGGAHRVELCDNLYEGGTTPSAASIVFTRKNIGIGLNVIIRPRGGDFIYSELEVDIMLQDITFCKQAGVDGVVLGALTPEGNIDIFTTTRLTQAAFPMTVTFHRAFDMVADPYKALNDIILCGCDRILTSGLQNKAVEGKDMIASLVLQAEDRIIIVAGSGVNDQNAASLVQYTGVKEIHTSSKSSYPSKMVFRNPVVFMGGISQIPEYENNRTDALKIKAVVESVKDLG
ncbi:MAG: copper homeostasis protein CutC [Bacteroidetes bacterium]|nr:copper homeostasis protein CutC [Bacteroidota bacterium]